MKQITAPCHTTHVYVSLFLAPQDVADSATNNAMTNWPFKRARRGEEGGGGGISGSPFTTHSKRCSMPKWDLHWLYVADREPGVNTSRSGARGIPYSPIWANKEHAATHWSPSRDLPTLGGCKGERLPARGEQRSRHKLASFRRFAAR